MSVKSLNAVSIWNISFKASGHMENTHTMTLCGKKIQNPIWWICKNDLQLKNDVRRWWTIARGKKIVILADILFPI